MTRSNDIWYLSAETRIQGELRGFSRQIRARPVHGCKVPAPVEKIAQEFLAEVIEGSDVHAYQSVLAGEHYDWPYRYVSYVLTCNGVEVVRSFGVRPIKPEVLTCS